MNDNNVYDAHADAAMACLELTEKIEKLKQEFDKAEADLLMANSVYQSALIDLETAEKELSRPS